MFLFFFFNFQKEKRPQTFRKNFYHIHFFLYFFSLLSFYVRHSFLLRFYKILNKFNQVFRVHVKAIIKKKDKKRDRSRRRQKTLGQISRTVRGKDDEP